MTTSNTIPNPPANSDNESFAVHDISATARASMIEDDLAMGPLESATFARHWRCAYRQRRYAAEVAEIRANDLAVTQSIRSAKNGNKFGRGLEGLRSEASRDDDEADDVDQPSAPSRKRALPPLPVNAASAAASLLLARSFDRISGLVGQLREKAPVVTIDVPDRIHLDHTSRVWRGILFPEHSRFLDISGGAARRDDYDVAFTVVKEAPKPRDIDGAETAALSALSMALPLIAITPLAKTHLPAALTKAASVRIDIGRLDAPTIVRTIRIVTGRPCRFELDPEMVERTGFDDLVIAVRADRSPLECLQELQRLDTAKANKRQSRDLTLAQLHGLGEARAWAISTIADVKAWKRSELPWSAISSSIALVGMPGTGKTTFSAVFAAEIGWPIISCSLAKWQSAGDGHLGHLLRAMREDFTAARSKPTVILLDEVDAFAARAEITHSHRDYVVTVVNGLLAEVDGIMGGKEGIIMIACANDLSHCEPALLRPGRFNPIIQIGLPDIAELKLMIRVRLGGDLAGDDIRTIAERAVGLTGADVEKLVNDARRIARRAGRPMVLADLTAAVGGEDDRPPELKRRTAVHEAGHIVTDVIHFGPEGIFATTAPAEGSSGRSVRTGTFQGAGTRDEYCRRLQVVLAGRVAEEILLGGGSHGAVSDLEKAATIAAAMIGSFGLAGPDHLAYLGPPGDARSFLALDDIRSQVNRELANASSACRSLLEANRAALEEVATTLLERGRIDGVAVDAIIEQRRRALGATTP